MVSAPDGAVTVPFVMVKAEVVVAAFAPKLHEPATPLNTSVLNGDDVATMSLVAVEVELNVTVPVCVKMEVDEANQLPASVTAFASIERMEVDPTPSWRTPVGRRKSPSGFPVNAFP